MTTGKALRQPAGKVLEPALPQKDGKSNLHKAAAIIVAGEHPGLATAERNTKRENWRLWLLRWVGGEDRNEPVGWIVKHRAETLARYFPVEVEDLTRPVSSEDEKKRQKLRRLEAQIERLRGEL